MSETKKESLWERTGIERDVVARRRTNTCEQVANITAQEIENGVSLETLLNLNVPVYRYQTQITIHGVLPDVQNGYAAGYKSIVKNGNGTVGVRYVGIDGAKKQTLASVNRLFRDATPLRAYLNSQGFTAHASCETPEEAVTLAKSVNTDLFYGTVCAYRSISLWGSVRYCVEVNIDAVPVGNLWAVAENLFGCPSEEAYNAEVQRVTAERDARSAEYDRQQAVRQAEIDAQEAKLRNLAGTVKTARMPSVPRKPGTFQVVRVLKGETEPRLDTVTFRYAPGTKSLEYTFNGTAYKPLKQYRTYWEGKAAKGYLFAG